VAGRLVCLSGNVNDTRQCILVDIHVSTAGLVCDARRSTRCQTTGRAQGRPLNRLGQLKTFPALYSTSSGSPSSSSLRMISVPKGAVSLLEVKGVKIRAKFTYSSTTRRAEGLNSLCCATLVAAHACSKHVHRSPPELYVSASTARVSLDQWGNSIGLVCQLVEWEQSRDCFGGRMGAMSCLSACHSHSY
jgi:hypothetical protein